MRTWIIVALVASGLVVAASHARAQAYTQTVYYSPPPTTYVQPAPVIAGPVVTYAQPVTVYRPVLRPWTTVAVPTPQPMVQTAYYSPQTMVVSQPVVSSTVQILSPTPTYSTRYRPIFGGTVTRTWYP